jgi:bacillithiol biosynthesis cysteine-adding enzyme BshC
MPLKTHSLPIEPKFFEKLVWDYLHQKLPTELYSFFPDNKGFHNALQQAHHFEWDRSILVQVLLNQASRVSNTSTITIDNIKALHQDNTYTITTGHQLCLFTGPLYFILKIIAVIQWSKKIQKQFPKYRIIPVFWMATEDHDIDEINHFYFKDKLFQWAIKTDGTPVFSLTTKGLENVLEELKASELFTNEHIRLFENAYIKHTSYVDATRYLLNELFGNEGLVILNPNEPSFKEKFKDFFFKDIFENSMFNEIKTTTKWLQQNHYHIQVNPPLINTFLIEDGKRYLIQKQEHQFTLKHHSKHFNEEELKSLLYSHPEKFNANVLLRPLYQQRILPNIAYIGGSAEVAYWMELKKCFDKHNAFYPIIIQRPIVFFIPQNIQQKILKLNINELSFFNQEKNKLINAVLRKFNLSIHLQNEKNEMEKFFQKLIHQTESIDKSLVPYVNAEHTKTLKFIDTLEQKLNKSIKQKNDQLVKQIDNIHQFLFPNNTMQDRIFNVSYVSKMFGFTSIQEFIKALVTQDLLDSETTFSFKTIQNKEE